MPSIAEILKIEDNNTDQIHLHQEGIFWKAYQQSAYAVIRKRTGFKLKKKFVKNVDREVISLGFPKTSLARLFDGETIETVDEKYIRITCPLIGEEEFTEWFDSVPPMLLQEKRTEDERYKQIESNELLTLKTAAYATDHEKLIINLLKEFRVESSTPMECMMFIMSLQQKLDKGNGNL